MKKYPKLDFKYAKLDFITPGYRKILKRSRYMPYYWLVLSPWHKQHKLLCNTYKRCIKYGKMPKCHLVCKGEIGIQCELWHSLKKVPDILGIIKVGE